MFMMQQWYDVQLNRALNKEQFELAQSVREEREALDKYLEKYLMNKGPGGGGSSVQVLHQELDVATRILTLQAEMTKAVEEENYQEAARLRDEIQQLNQKKSADSDKQALDAEWGCVSSPPRYRLGQRVLWKRQNQGASDMRGLVVGWDTQCCESEEWSQQNGVKNLKAGSCQPFYHLLVDNRDWEIDNPEVPPVAYAPEETLWSPEDEEDAEWGDEFETEFKHPYVYNLFYGKDHNGDMVPIFPLKTKFGEKIEE
eukprot:TRINITY_DN2376_c0_g1_i5.p1 TRINITY_DN2376_c0_g1~~TRINITY_DN2376_c0_g1_i5.p1  ORF type:complete len:256 (-),score=46.72 TRINITY_DN2376_c0_g1_i5:145-912(-)